MLRITLSALRASFVCLALLAPGLFAASIGYTSEQAPDSAVVLAVPANYLAVEVRIQSAEDDWALRLDAIAAARRELATAAAAAGLKLESTRPVSFERAYGGKASGSSFSVVSYSYESRVQPGSVLRILAPLDPQKPDTLVLLKRIKAVVDGLRISKKTTVSLGAIRLGIDDPESLRPRLLEEIAAHVSRTQAALAARDQVLSGVDEPLSLAQLDEATVGVFLPFRTEYRRAPAPPPAQENR